MMGKLPLGVVSPYVKMSSGGCTDPLKFYATSYCTAYGREDFKPRMGSHRGTGYKSNYRPVVSYQPHLDALDNPAMGEQVCNNFQTVTSQSYRPLEVPDGTCPLPWNLHQTSSGYSREKASAVTPIKEVRKVHFDTQDYGPQAITGLEPKDVPLLHQQQNKGSLEWENARHPYGWGQLVPGQQRGLSFADLLQKNSIGAKEETGFTEESNKNPIVFQPPSQALPGDPGDEFLPVLARGSERETGFSRVNERTLNPRVSGLKGLSQSGEHSEGRGQGAPNPHSPPDLTSPLSTLLVQEPSGFSLNNPSYVRSPYDPDMDNRYLTTYNQGYFENIPKGLDREGWTRGGLQPQKPGGYALNQPVTRLEATPSPSESLRRLHPHVGR
ncbi:hypothetical protein MJG53_021123 [Ovis ammon polii x Ovis aries]|uniref:Uncharacterized protein n=1 Tax=Ovis ammon polii x Ovis aries TaxID=2918886 RepID=A0ACB9UAS6_9CETA|nr:hypothetical protein MJG53_021123 [Ovis ammon polii x Ovis aries]